MEHLELLKILSSYLPYNVRFVFLNIQNPKYSYHLVSVGNIQCAYTFNLKENTEIYYLQKKYIKLILKPLSDLDKLIKREFEKYNILIVNPKKNISYNKEIIYLFGEENIGNYENISELNLRKLPYECIEFMFKNHYDFYGLIEKRLAIDINTLNIEK